MPCFHRPVSPPPSTATLRPVVTLRAGPSPSLHPQLVRLPSDSDSDDSDHELNLSSAGNSDYEDQDRSHQKVGCGSHIAMDQQDLPCAQSSAESPLNSTTHEDRGSRSRRTGSPRPTSALHGRVLSIHQIKHRRRQATHLTAETAPTVAVNDDSMTAAVDSSQNRPQQRDAGAGSLLCRSPPSCSLSSHVFLAMAGVVPAPSPTVTAPAVSASASSSSTPTSLTRRRKRTVSSPSRSFGPHSHTRSASAQSTFEWSPLTPSPLGGGPQVDSLNNLVDQMSVEDPDTGDHIQTKPSTLLPQRRASFQSTNSAELHGSFLGTYEESVLNGRLSTPPSRPISFLCQIGVVGLDPKSPAELRCPPHVTIPFQASFYEWSRASESSSNLSQVSLSSAAESPLSSRRSTLSELLRPSTNLTPSVQQLPHSPTSPTIDDRSSGSMTEELGTPYVGTVDLEWGLGPLNEFGYAHHGSSAPVEPTCATPAASTSSSRPVPFPSSSTNISSAVDRLPSYRSVSDPVGYLRLPLKGRLQLMIRNQQKAVVKVFLVPYDFREMPVHTRTFIRQKTFLRPQHSSAVVSSRSGSGALRHAIHLSFICMPGKNQQPRSRRSSVPARTDCLMGDQTTAPSPLSTSAAEEHMMPPLSADATRKKSSSRSSKLQKYVYLHKSIRVVFGHRIVEAEAQLGERVEVLAEGPHGLWVDESGGDLKQRPALDKMFPHIKGHR